jgi:LCP family protein required for cell wall assembly
VTHPRAGEDPASAPTLDGPAAAGTEGGRGRLPGPAFATLLSAVWPGLGQWSTGRRRTALLHALPPLAVVVALVTVALWMGLERTALLLFQPAISLGLLAAIVALGLWRLGSMLHARAVASRRATQRQRRAGWLTLAVAGVAVVATHLFAANYAWAFYQAGERIFDPPPIGGTPDPTPGPTPGPSLAPGQTATPVPSLAPGETPTPAPTAAPTPVPTGRINVLFIGIDATPVRDEDHRLTDTIMLASFDPSAEDQRVDMVSVPRDIARFPLYDRPRVEFDDKINELMHYADTHPDEYPDGGIATLVRQVEYLLGVPIDYWATIEIPGFPRMIDAVGGVRVVNERLIDDPEYKHPDGSVGYRLEPGEYHMDGEQAIVYVRSRKGPNNTDFQRARRQQQVVLQLRERLRDPAVIARVPEILTVAAETVRTNLPPEQLPMVMDLAQRSQGARVKSVVLGPATYAELIPADEIRGLYALRLKLDEVARLSVQLWGEESRYFEATGSLAP